MLKKICISLSSIVLVSIALSSCGEKKEEVKDEEVTTDTLSDEVRTNLNLIRVSIPSPLEVTKLLSKSGYNYNKSILNPSGKSSSYSSKFQAASNLGVYGADLGYVAGYNQTQDVMEYAAQIMKLAKTVGVESAFDQEFGKNLTENKSDTLMGFIDEAYAKAERNLRSNERVSTSALIIAGGWIEGLYIASGEVSARSQDDKNGELYHNIYNHVYAFKYVIDLLSQYKNNPDCAKMLEELNTIQSTIEPYREKTRPTQEDALKIKEIILPIRSKIVS